MDKAVVHKLITPLRKLAVKNTLIKLKFNVSLNNPLIAIYIYI